MNSNPAFASLLRIRIAVLLALAAGGVFRLRPVGLASFMRLAVGLAALAVAAPSAHAQGWSGSASGNWSNAANWSPSAPATGNTLTWNATAIPAITNLTSFNDIADLSVGSLNFTGAPAGVVLNGNALTLSGSGSTSVLRGNGTINMNLSLTGAAPQLGGAGNDIVVNGVISSSASTISISGGAVTLSGANTYSGNTTIGTGLSTTLIINTLKNVGVA
jgi:autotransporter-associated beta strand protein